MGLGWSASDERKMQKSFGFGRANFARFIDLQEVHMPISPSRVVRFDCSSVPRWCMPAAVCDLPAACAVSSLGGMFVSLSVAHD